MTSFGKLDVRGPGALPLLQRLTDNDVGKPPGSVVYTQFLNSRGGIEADVTVIRLADERFRVVTGSGFVPGDLGWIRMHLPRDGSVEVREVTDELAVIGLWGPAARRVLQGASRDDVSNAAFPYLAARSIRIGPADVWAQRVTYVGELGWELYVPAGNAGAVWDALLAAGRAGGHPRRWATRRSTRSGSRRGTATGAPTSRRRTIRTRPASDSASAWGRATSSGARRSSGSKAAGVTRRLATVAIDPASTIYGGEAVWQDGRVLGRLRSGGYGYTVGRNIGLVYLPVDLAGAVGAPLEVEVFGDRVPAEVAPGRAVRPAGSADPRLSRHVPGRDGGPVPTGRGERFRRGRAAIRRGRAPGRRPARARAGRGRRRTSGRPRGSPRAGSRR